VYEEMMLPNGELDTEATVIADIAGQSCEPEELHVAKIQRQMQAV
jgi:hypothetical protein